MGKRFRTIQKCAYGFAALFLGAYALDYVPGIMDKNGLMFNLFHMSKLIDFGHLAGLRQECQNETSLFAASFCRAAYT